MTPSASINSGYSPQQAFSASSIDRSTLDGIDSEGIALNEQHERLSLPPPLTEPSSDFDLVSLVMALSEKIGQNNTNRSEMNLQLNHEKLQKVFEELKSKLAEALKQAEDAQRKHDRGGFFGAISNAIGAIFSAIGEAIGAIVGTVADFVIDMVTQPLDILKGLINGKNIEDILNQEFNDMTTNGGVAKTVEDCAKGVFAFVGDVVNLGNLALGAMEAGARGQNVGDFLKGEGEALLDSLKKNIINNPAVMKVVGVVLKVAAIAAMALGTITFGVGAAVAVGLLALAELNEQTGLAKAIAGEKAGAWISLGLQLAATVVSMIFLGGAGANTGALKGVTIGAAVLQGVGASSMAYEQYKQTNKDADAIDTQAELQHILFRMQRLQREGDALLESLEGETKSIERNRRIGSQLVETQALTQEAAIMRA